MKKINLLFSIFMFSILVSNAQVIRTVHDEQHDRLIKTLLSQSSKKTAPKSTYTSEQLVATSAYGTSNSFPSWHRVDSAAYKYTGGSGSEFDFNAMRFMRYYPISSGSPSGMSMGIVDITTKNFNGRSLFQYSSSRHWDEWNSLNDSSHIGYNANDDVVLYSDTTLQGYPTWNKTINQYDASDKIIFSDIKENISSYPDTAQRYYFYNSSGDLIKDSTYVSSMPIYAFEYKNEYAYNSAGNISQIRCYKNTYLGWLEANRYVMTYYNSLQLKKVELYDMTVGSLYFIDSFGWSAGVDYYTYHTGINIISDTFINSVKTEVKHISPSTLLPDTVTAIDYYYGGAHPDTGISKNSYEYDGFGMPVKSNYYEYFPLIMVDSLISTTYYYYKPNTTAVSANEVCDRHLSIFPNPTSGIFTILLPTQNEDVELFVYDITGKLILNKSISNSSSSTIDLSNQLPGNYIIKVTSGDQIFRDRVVIR